MARTTKKSLKWLHKNCPFWRSNWRRNFHRMPRTWVMPISPPWPVNPTPKTWAFDDLWITRWKNWCMSWNGAKNSPPQKCPSGLMFAIAKPPQPVFPLVAMMLMRMAAKKENCLPNYWNGPKIWSHPWTMGACIGMASPKTDDPFFGSERIENFGIPMCKQKVRMNHTQTTCL